MKFPSIFLVWLLAGIGFISSCSSRHDTDEHEHEVHAGAKPKPAPEAAPLALGDTLQLLAQQLDTVRRLGCWDEALCPPDERAPRRGPAAGSGGSRPW